LTIPFLVGADLQFVRKVPASKDPIGDLFNAIVSGEAFEFCTTLGYCGTIAAYRFGLIPRVEVVSPYFTNRDGEPTLAFDNKEFISNDLNDMIDLMKAEYQQSIDAGNFSKGRSVHGVWEPFTKTDTDFIKRALY
jgi:hypothetical protein